MRKWIQTVTPDQLPTPPFRINHHTTVVDSGRWLAKLQAEAKMDGDFWRIRHGILQRELKWIRDYIEGTDNEW